MQQLNKYEYLVGALINFSTPEQEQEVLNKHGAFGWELVSVAVKNVKGDFHTFYYLRRLKISKGGK